MRLVIEIDDVQSDPRIDELVTWYQHYHKTPDEIEQAVYDVLAENPGELLDRGDWRFEYGGW